MQTLDPFTYFENKFDRLTYQNDVFFWLLVLFHVGVFYASLFNWIPSGNMGTICTILGFFAASWAYTNARRRAWSRIRAFLFALPTFFHPLIGGILYFIFRPKEIIVTALPPSKPGVWPVFQGPVWIFAYAPFRFLIKLALWLMGLTFLIIAVLDIFGKL